MKKNLPYLVLVLTVFLLLSACTRTQSTPAPAIDEPSPTPGVLTQLPDAIASQTAAPTPVEEVPTLAPPEPTEDVQNPPEESAGEPPTATEEETSTEITLVPKDQPTATSTPTAIPPGETFDPTETYGLPTFVDPMNSGSYGNWKSGGRLPNTDLIQISLENDNLYVTGKKPGFSTWYFSWPTLTDFYIQVEVKTGECSGKDEYGLIVRGPAHGAGVSYGYIVAFSCDGYYRLTRLDSADPYSATDLVSSIKSTDIQSGADQKNVLAIRAVGKKLTVFANGHQLAEVSDAAFSVGRYGLFVQAVETYNYTYHPVQIVYWDLEE